MVVSNFTPVPRDGYRLGVPAGAIAWRELINTDAQAYGGSGGGNGSLLLPVESVAAHGRPASIRVNLPPLATLYLVVA